jgi:hypothetical protein
VKIKNPFVKEYYDYLDSVYRDTDNSERTRIEANKRMQVVENLVDIYENNYNLDFEDLTWVEIGDPLLPEEGKVLVDKFKKYLKDIEDKDR